MDCVIPGPNIKVITKAIQALSKIGDELYFQGKSDRLLLITMNSTKTVYVTFTFLDSFFSSYASKPFDNSDCCTCKVLTKAIAGIFRGNKEKKVELCRISLNCDTKMVIKLKYKYDVTMTHSVRLLDSETLSIKLPKSTNVNHIMAPSSVYSQILTMFPTTDEDISLDITKTKAIARNYDNGFASSVRNIRTQIALNATEFYVYKIDQETNITLALKPLKAAVQFAEIFNVNVTINFHTAGRPLILGLKSQTFEADFVISTLSPDGDTQTSTTSVTTLSKLKQKPREAISDKDKTAIESVDWDDDFGVQNEGNVTKSSEKPKSFADVMDSLRKKPGNGALSRVAAVGETETEAENDFEVVDLVNSPESPRKKRVRLIFGRCYEPTFHTTMLDLGEVLAENSGSESDV